MYPVNAGRTCNHLINQEVLWEKHRMHIDLVLERLQIYGLTCSLELCHVSRRESPTYTKFLGICLWTNEYISDFSRIPPSMTALLSLTRPRQFGRPARGYCGFTAHHLDIGTGAVMYQVANDGTWRIISPKITS